MNLKLVQKFYKPMTLFNCSNQLLAYIDTLDWRCQRRSRVYFCESIKSSLVGGSLLIMKKLMFAGVFSLLVIESSHSHLV